MDLAAGAAYCSGGDGVLLMLRDQGMREIGRNEDKGHKVREAVAAGGGSGDRPEGRERSSY